MLARTPAQVIAGEAVHGTLQERFNDMLHIASVAENRSLSMSESLANIVSAISPTGNKEFDAYNKAMPPGTRSLVGLAQQAINQVQQYGPVTDATFYATPKAVAGLPDHLKFETSTTGHRYFSDPLNRSINTANGFKVPNPAKIGMKAQLATTTSTIPDPAAVDPSYAVDAQIAGVPGPSSVPANTVTTSSQPVTAVDPAFAAGWLNGNYPAGFVPSAPVDQPTANFAQGLADRVIGAQTGVLSPEMEARKQQVAQQLKEMQAPASVPIAQRVPTSSVPLSADQAAQLASQKATGFVPGTMPAMDTSAVAARPVTTTSYTQAPASDPNASLAAGLAAQRDYSDPSAKTSRLTGNVAETADPGRMNVSDDTVAAVNRALQDSISRALSVPDSPTVSSFPDMAAADPVKTSFADPNASLAAGIQAQRDYVDPAQKTGRLTGNVAQTSDPARMDVPDSAIASVDRALQDSIARALSVPDSPTISSFPAMASAQPVKAPPNVTATLEKMGVPDLSASAQFDIGNTLFGPTIPQQQVQEVAANPPMTTTMGVTATGDAVAPVTKTPTLNNFASLASAGPMAASVQASPSMTFGSPPDLSAAANAVAANEENFSSRFGLPTPTDQVMSTPTAYTDVQQMTPSEAAISRIMSPSTITNQLGLPNVQQPSIEAPNFNQAVTNSLPSLMGPATVTGIPGQSVQQPGAITQNAISAYQQMADTAFPGGITNLSGTTLVGPTGVATSTFPQAVTAPTTTTTTDDPNVSLDTPNTAVQPLQTVTVPNQPKVAPVSYTAPASQSLTDATRSITQAVAPQKTAMDVWNGLATTGIATDGSTVTKMEDGTIGRYNPAFNHTEYTNADGSYGGLKKGNTLSGLSEPSLTSASSTKTPTSFDPNASLSRMSNSIFSAGTLGSLAGAALGTALAGPIGGLALGMIGQKLGGTYLGDKVPDESPMHALLGLFTGSPSVTSTNTIGATTSTEPGGGGGVTGTSTGPTGGGYSHPGLF